MFSPRHRGCREEVSSGVTPGRSWRMPPARGSHRRRGYRDGPSGERPPPPGRAGGGAAGRPGGREAARAGAGVRWVQPQLGADARPVRGVGDGAGKASLPLMGRREFPRTDLMCRRLRHSADKWCRSGLEAIGEAKGDRARTESSRRARPSRASTRAPCREIRAVAPASGWGHGDRSFAGSDRRRAPRGAA